MAQISREEWLRRFGRSTERPMPQNIVGLPPADEVAAELIYAQSFQQPREAAPTERPIAIREGDRTTYRRFGDNSIQALPRGGKYEGLQADRRAIDDAIQLKMRQQAVSDALAQGTPAEEVFSGFLARPVSPSIASRAGQYMDILGLKPEQAVKLAEREAISAGSPRGKVSIPANWVQAIADSGELGPDPAAQGVLRAAIEGQIDVETPVEAQTSALDPYMRAAEAVAMDPRNQFQDLSPQENADINLETGAGRKLRGGRRNPFNKEVKERVSDPYLVPVLLAEASEPVWQKDPAGQWRQAGAQPPTLVVGVTPEGRKQKVFDASAVELGLLDPRTPLPADMGYLRFEEPSKEVRRVTRGQRDTYGAEVNAPTLERSGGEVHGFDARDDIAVPRNSSTSVPMTLGQAVQDILYRNRTPIKPYRDEDLWIDEAGQLYHRQTNTPVYLIEDQPENLPVKDYRVGSEGIYDKQAYQEFGKLIEGVTGRPLRLVVNERLQDQGLNQLQREALEASLPADWIRSKPGRSSAYDVMTALARGASLPPSDVTVTPLANAPSERAFYMEGGDGRGLGIQARLNALKEAAIAQERASVGATPDVMAQIPEGARGNVEAGLQAPRNSPRFRAAQDFLQRFLARRA